MIRLFFTGDIAYKKNRKLLSNELNHIVNSHDIKCCNLEAPIVEETMNIEKAKKAGPSLCQGYKEVEELLDNGFNMFSLANNHIMDYGVKGLNNTIEFLKDQIVIGAGNKKQDAYEAKIIDRNNIKVGFLSLAENGFGSCIDKEESGYAWMNYIDIENNIKSLKEKCDYVIINCHAGAELFEYPLPEIRELYKKFIDWGANIIIGHHPHVMQAYESYKKGIIFYSLGNFAFSRATLPECKESYCVSIELDEKNYNWKIIPVIFEEGQVLLNKGAKEKIEKLSEEINSHEYLERINKFCIEKYKNTYKNYYLSCFNINRSTMLNKLKSCIKMLFNMREDNEELLYHNIAIETHLWICRRALNLIIKEGKSNDKK